MPKQSGKTTPKRGKKAVTRPAAVTKKKPSATKKTVSIPQARRLKSKPAKRLSLRRAPRQKHPVRLPKARLIMTTAWLTVWKHRKLFASISLVYGLVNFVLGRGFSAGVNIAGLQAAFNQSVGGHPNPVVSGIGTFSRMLGASDGSNRTSGPYELFLLLFVSLAIIWALRQVLARVKISLRDAYYRSMSPLIPFILVLLFIIVQLIPFSLGAELYSYVVNNGILVGVSERLVSGLLLGLVGIWTLYMLSASVFALYIVTLPDMTPQRALQSAREIVRHRRWTVLRKILWLPLVLFGLGALILIPTIIVYAPLAQWVYLLFGVFVPVFVHSYMYTLYRELLREK